MSLFAILIIPNKNQLRQKLQSNQKMNESIDLQTNKTPFSSLLTTVVSRIQFRRPLEDLLQNIQNIEVSDAQQAEQAQQRQTGQQKIDREENSNTQNTRQVSKQPIQINKKGQSDEQIDNQFMDKQMQQRVSQIDHKQDQPQSQLQIKQTKINQLFQQKEQLPISKSQQIKKQKIVSEQTKEQGIQDNQTKNKAIEVQQKEKSYEKIEVSNQVQQIQTREGDSIQLQKVIQNIISHQKSAFQHFAEALDQVQIQQVQETQRQQYQNSQQDQILAKPNQNEEMKQFQFVEGNMLNKLKDQLSSFKNQETDQYITAKLQENQLKKNLLRKALSILSKSHNEAIKQAYQNFKNTDGQISKSFKQSGKLARTLSRKLNSSSSRRKSERGNSDDFNFQLTMQSKNSRNLFNMSKQDSLMYSNGTDFGVVMERSVSPPKKKVSESQQNKQNGQQKERQKSASNKVLRKIEDQGDFLQQPINWLQEPSNIVNIKKSESKQIIERMPGVTQERKFDQNSVMDEYSVTQQIQIPQRNSIHDHKSQNDQQNALITQSLNFQKLDQQKRRANSLFKKRIDTEVDKPLKNKPESRHSFKKFNKIDSSRLSESNSNTNIFSTEINNYQLRIAKIKESKLLKKKKLQQELAKVNRDIDELNNKEQELSPEIKPDFAIRNQIANDKEALSKAESLIKNLRSQKKHRQIAKLSEFKSLDKNINDYMVQLSRMREQNEMKLKQKKKLQILDRMKQKEMAKANQRKKKQESINFVLHLKSPYKQHHQQQQKMTTPPISKNRIQSHYTEENITPELSSKKAYLSKVRNISVKKSKPDLYQQRLS